MEHQDIITVESYLLKLAQKIWDHLCLSQVFKNRSEQILGKSFFTKHNIEKAENDFRELLSNLDYFIWFREGKKLLVFFPPAPIHNNSRVRQPSRCSVLHQKVNKVNKNKYFGHKNFDNLLVTLLMVCS